MKCSFCGKEFDEQAQSKVCRNCALFGGCKMVRCPHCGYESPREPGLVKTIRKWVHRHDRSKS